MVKIKLQRRESAPKNESIGSVTRNSDRYKEAFMIDCGTPENALALVDAFMKAAFKEDGYSYNIPVIGGELIQCWPVGRFFTANVDPCEKAIVWCQDFLKNVDGSAPGLTGNGTIEEYA